MSICLHFIISKNVIDSRKMNSAFISVKFVSVGVVAVQIKLSEQDLTSSQCRHFMSPIKHVQTPACKFTECMPTCLHFITLRYVIDSRLINSAFIGVKFGFVGAMVVQIKLSEQLTTILA